MMSISDIVKNDPVNITGFDRDSKINVKINFFFQTLKSSPRKRKSSTVSPDSVKKTKKICKIIIV